MRGVRETTTTEEERGEQHFLREEKDKKAELLWG